MRRLALLTLLVFGCDPSPSVPDAGVRDAGPQRDSGARDAGTLDAGRDSGPGPSASFCDALDAFMTRCGASAGACDGTLQTHCDAVVGLLDPGFVASVDACLAGDNPTNCFFEALDGRSPSTAQRDFGDAFCAGCRADDTSCASGFFTGAEAASAIARAVNDDTVSQIEMRCASGVLCGERVDGCTEETLTLLGLPEAASSCVLETLLSDNELPRDCGGMPDAGTDGGVDGGLDAGMADAGPGDAGMPDGGPPAACTSFEPNDESADAPTVGSITDRSSFPAGNFSSGLSAGDEDWFSYVVRDVTGGLFHPRVDLVPEGSANLQLCAFFDCDSEGDSDMNCRAGVATTLGGLDGCCSENPTGTEMVELEPDCTSFDESGRVYVRVFTPDSVSTCEPYFVAWGDD